MTKASARSRLLAAAREKFYADGIAATGVDGIVESAGVAKMSLYNNFGSKAELVVAYLEARHQEWLDLYSARLEGAETSLDGVLAVVDAYIDDAHAAHARGFRGCGLLNAAAELPAGDPGRRLVAKHKADVEELIRGHLSRMAGEKASRDGAEEISFVLEGAMARAGLEGSDRRLRTAREIIARIVGHL
ncbi:TetR/AcrR family transcriptional regulator [Zhihengliuella alba]|uniref:TetR/AcrR family transcriptional regulator n=1 Tax=Zhihengliuella alba TaxID=547018 RepID=A0ABP7DNB1_9MICC